MLLAIMESAVDMSPFVRRTAAYAIPKLNSLEPDIDEGRVDCCAGEASGRQDYS